MAKRPGTPSRAKGTSKLPDSAFAYPKKRKYPLNTAKRRRNALARAGQRGTFGSRAHVARRIKQKYGKRSGVKSLQKSKRRKKR